MLAAVGLTKLYSGVPVVRDVSFEIQPGQILGYLGPNGSGKSTTVRMLTGLIEPARGEVRFRGSGIRNNLPAYKAVLGYVPEEAALYPHLTGLEYLELVAHLRDLPAAVVRRRTEAFLELFALAEHKHAPVSAYSKGMRQRLLISAALLHDPQIVILDEPESGLDVTTALTLRKLIAALAREGKAVLYCSHILEVVEKVCTHVLVLHRGVVVGHDSVEGIRGLASAPSLEGVFATLTQQADPDRAASGLIEAMRL
ncbi:MAG TPA: ABC transporter ATP-binding protein [Bryobacteraceae bacterium]|nr:ABC transporter ATP-binding protein [Bryobacteraceae bacterium]